MSSLKWKPFILILVSCVLLIALIFGLSSLNDRSSRDDSKKKQNNASSKTILWGVDSASSTTNQSLTCVNKKFGTPEVWGRYLGNKDNVSKGLTSNEVKRLHSKKIKILLINNQFESATGYKNGLKQAQVGIRLAEKIKAPNGVAIFADIEPTYEVDSGFIKGYYDGMKKSKYSAGIYGVFSKEKPLFKAFHMASKENNSIKNETIIWSAYPQNGVTSKGKKPNYSPDGPKGSKLLGWQYGLDAKGCHIDTNLFKGEIIEYLW